MNSSNSLQWLGKTPPIYTYINTTVGAAVSIDLFDFNFTVSVLPLPNV